jgi:hypothetical protein
MLKAPARGETDPAKLAAVADGNLRAGADTLCNALSAAATLDPARPKLLKIALERFEPGLPAAARFRAAVCRSAARIGSDPR